MTVNLAALSRKIVRAAETGETEWPSDEAFRARFSIDAPKEELRSLALELDQLGWTLRPAKIENFETIRNAFGQGRDAESAKLAGYLLERNTK